MLRPWRLFLLGCVLILFGAFLASAIQTAGGIQVKDVRFRGANGATLSALVYIPSSATPQTPAPGILAVHGYINSRETQSGFAIEFARRGYVVVEMDQMGHGYSSAPAFANGFGGPDGLKYLRSLPMVDKANIGLEGHSMGGWTVLAAAAAMPDDYRSIVLEGSSTGKPYAMDGTPAWPRNLGLVYSQYDEFSKFMWGVDRAQDVTASPKLKAVFGTTAKIVPDRIYGDIAKGTARRVSTPATTHPGDHISGEAIGDSLDWFGRTLKGGLARPADDQIWIWKEVGTGVALIGFVALLLGTFDGLLTLPLLLEMRRQSSAVIAWRSGGWWARLGLSAFVPVLTLFPVFIIVTVGLPASHLFRQTVTNQVTLWALVNTAITLGLGRFWSRGPTARFYDRWGLAALSAILTVGAGYAALVLCDLVFKVDFRFWVVALKPMSLDQWSIAPIYFLPLTLFFVVTLRTLHGGLAVKGDGAAAQYLTAILALAGGFLVFLGLDYGILFATGNLITGFDPLTTVIAIQFLPLMSIIAVIAVFTWRRTNSYVPGALICALFVTWYMVAGTATQAI